MARNLFEFDVYRLNVVEGDRTLFEQNNSVCGSDKDIMKILNTAIQPDVKYIIEGKRAKYEWTMRNYEVCDYSDGEKSDVVIFITMARSMSEKMGEIVTDDGMEEGLSESNPPLAEPMMLFFYLKRHLVAVEHISKLMTSGRWQESITELTKQSAEKNGYSCWFALEPVPEIGKILEAFNTFTKLIRLRVKLRLPNPELSRYAKSLYDEMVNGGIREYLQDMRSGKGLSKEPGRIPHAATEIAQAGYKDGQIRLEGYLDGKHKVVETGEKAVRGSIDSVRDYVRGVKAMAKTKEGKTIIADIIREIDRIVPAPDERSK